MLTFFVCWVAWGTGVTTGGCGTGSFPREVALSYSDKFNLEARAKGLTINYYIKPDFAEGAQ